MKSILYCILGLTLVTPAFAVTISSPTNGETVHSPFTLSADASTCSSQPISAMGYSLDSSPDTTTFAKSSIDTSVSAGTGTHTVHVKAWGDKGAVCVAEVDITIDTTVDDMLTASSPSIPSNAVKVSSLQAMGGWSVVHDSGTGGSASGSTGIVGTPTRTGGTRKYAMSYSDHGGIRYKVSFGDDASATNFFYDVWVYLNSSASHLANLEMDMNQVMPNGQTVIYGFQCDGYSSTWDVTANTGSPSKPHDEWIHTGAHCNPRSWSQYAWHHVQVQYSRSSSGVVTFHYVWLDGARTTLNKTVAAAFALGWSPTLLTNFQVDGLGTSGSVQVYMDDLTVYRW
jgi:hypothetical protein